MSTVSTYMGFPISTIGVDSGLNWETNLNAALAVIDQHNHSPGQGQQIQPSGLNINSDLTIQSNNLTNIRASRFSPLVSTIPNTGSDVGELYVSGNELYYNDVSGGNQVQITSSGAVNSTSSGISSGTASAAFSAGVLLVKSSSTSFGNVALQSVLLSNSGNLTNQLTLQAPTLTGSFTETLPSIPGVTSFMTMDSSGNMATGTPLLGALTGSNLSSSANIGGTQLSASAGIQGSQLGSAAGIVPAQLDTLTSGSHAVSSASCGSFSTTSGTFVTVTNLDVTLPSIASARPIFFNFSWDASGPANIAISTPSGVTNSVQAIFSLQAFTGPSTVTTINQYILELGAPPPGSGGTFLSRIPASALNFIYPTNIGGGTSITGITGRFRLQVSVSGGTAIAANTVMNIYQV